MSEGVAACGGCLDRFKAFCRDPETQKFAQRTAVVVVALAAILVVTGFITGVYTECHVGPSNVFLLWYFCMWGGIGLVAATVGLIMLKRKLKGKEAAAEEPKSKSLWGSEELSESSSGKSAAVGVGFKRARIIAMIASLAVVAIGASVILWSCVIQSMDHPFIRGQDLTELNQIISDMKIAGSAILISGAIAFAASFFATAILKKLGVSCMERRLAKEISEGGFGNRSGVNQEDL